MKNDLFAIIEIGSNNTKTHIYQNGKVIKENTTTIEFKKNYHLENKVKESDLEKLFSIIIETSKDTKNIHIYGCSIFRIMETKQLEEINERLKDKFGLKIEVVTQEEEASYTALGCYHNVDYKGNICIFIGGGGSIELILVNDKKVLDRKYYNFGVVDVTRHFDSLKEDIPNCSFDEVYCYVDELMGDLDIKADVFILAGGDHLYWYNNAGYELLQNTLYESENQQYMLTLKMSDEYDKDALVTSLDRIRNNSDNPLWFDGSRAMKVITNFISHKIDAKYIVPTKINMEDGLKDTILKNRK